MPLLRSPPVRPQVRRLPPSRCKARRLSEIAHISNDEAEAWFCKIDGVQGARGHKDHALLERDFPQSNITGYDLAKDKIIYLWGVQRRKRAIEVEKERK